jgi:hypothetical protein
MWSQQDIITLNNARCTAKKLYRKLETNFPRNKTMRPRSQFLHYICERFMYFHDRSAYYAAVK